MKSQTIFITIVVLLTVVRVAQSRPDSLWSRTYGGPGDDVCEAIISTTDGGFAMAGRSNSFGAGPDYYHAFMIRTDENGDTLWTYFDDSQRVIYDMIFALVQTEDGGFALAGAHYIGDPVWRYNYWLLRIDEDGEYLWSQTYDRTTFDWCYDLVQTGDGGFALAGHSGVMGDDEADFWLVRTDEDGDSLWSRSYGGDDNEVCYALVQTEDDGFAMAGRNETIDWRNWRSWLLKVDEDGDSLWSCSFGQNLSEKAFDLVQTEDGGYTLAGATSGFGCNGRLSRASQEGDSLWSRTMGDNLPRHYISIISLEGGGYALAGGSIDNNYWLVLCDSTGQNLRGRTFDFGNNSECVGVVQTEDGGLALGGTVRIGERVNGDQDFWLVRTGRNPFPRPPFSLIEPINQDTLDEAFVLFFWEIYTDTANADTAIYDLWIKNGGDSVSFSTEDDAIALDLYDVDLPFEDWVPFEWWVEAIAGPDTVECQQRYELWVTPENRTDLMADQPFSFDLSIYPNPFNSSTTITYSLDAASDVKIQIFDLHGRTVYVVDEGGQFPGMHSVSWNGNDHQNRPVNSGLYFYSLTATSKEGRTVHATRKMILIR